MMSTRFHPAARIIGCGVATSLALAAAGFSEAARAAEPLVQAAGVAASAGNPHVAVVDVRPAAAFQAGHIPGAISADYRTAGWTVPGPGGAAAALPPVERLAAAIGALGVGDGDEIVIVAGDFPAAARVYWTFKVLGHTEVSILDGGWAAWSGPVESGSAPRGPAVFTPHYNAALRAELPEVAAALARGSATLVDARPASQWSGSVLSPLVHAGGHIPGAVSLDESAILTADGRLKPPDALAQLFAPAGEKPAIVYCNAGYLSAADWFVLSEVLHRPDAKLYEGSMSEWTSDASRPVVR
jgi:thiosulfate/3-mercaptopyruvate sulfurtransferase